MARAAAALAAVLAASGAIGAPTGATIPFGSHGHAVDGTSGQPVALTPTTLLVTATGPDGTAGTADDETLLVSGIGTSPSVRGLSTGFVATNASRIERLSATRAVVVSAGADAAFGTADDALHLLDRLGSEDAVTTIVVGGLGDSQQFTPERLTSERFVLPSLGTDLLPDTADDEVLVVTTSTTPPTVLRLAAPFQRAGGRSRVAALSTTDFLVASDGPDGKAGGADDLVHLFRPSGAAWSRTDLAVPGLNRRAAGRPVRLSARHGLVVSAGPDFADSTADDRVFLVDAVDGTAVPIAVPFAKNSSGGQCSPLSATTAAVGTLGADGIVGTADDAVAILSDLGGTNAVSSVVVGATADNNECRPARLDDGTFALCTLGSDRVIGTADDEVTLVHGVGGTPLVQHVVIGAVAAGTASTIVPVSSSALLLSAGGADDVVGTSDDAVVLLSGIGSTLGISRVVLGGALDAQDAFRFVPAVLGGGRAALLSSGADDDLGAGGDDGIRIIGGLDLGRTLSVRSLDVRYARSPLGGRRRPAKVSVRAVLTLEGAGELLGEDLTVSVGNASQTLPAGSLAEVRGGRRLAYADPSGAGGIVRSLEIDVATGRLRMEVRGADREIATTVPGYVPVGFEVGGHLVPESLSARPGPHGFSYRRPRGR